MVNSVFERVFRGQRVFVTGHTGFKGAWLTQWLLSLGAEVCGYALAPPTRPALFDSLNLSPQICDIRADLRDGRELVSALKQWQPQFVFHLAAQPLVRTSYAAPFETFEINVLGTLQLLEALRLITQPCVAIIVTSDKCYENQERVEGYLEDDRLGGLDPYSASKAMCELAVNSYRHAYFLDQRVRLASARAGNVIGGGDWAADRIIPDCIRALQNEQSVVVRNPHASRPWQHVLEPLSGYLTLAMQLASANSASRLHELCTAFNFGPSDSASQTVQQLVDEVLRYWPGTCQDHSDPHAPHEAKLLSLNISKARRLLNWTSRFDFATTVKETVQWYRRVHGGEDPKLLTLQQIATFEQTPTK